MPTPLNLLIWDDGTAKTESLLDSLRSGGFDPSYRVVRSRQAMDLALDSSVQLVLVANAADAGSVKRFSGLPAGFGLRPIVLIVGDPPAKSGQVPVQGVEDAEYVASDRASALPRAVSWALREQELTAEIARLEEALRNGRRTEAVLRQSEEQYRNMVEGAMEGLTIHQNGTIRFANRAAAKLAGYDDASDLVGRNIWETFVAPEARAELKARGAACVAGHPQPMHSGWPGLRKDGSRAWVQSSVAPIRWQGQPALLGYFADVTERKRAEDSLRASEERFSKAFHGSPLPVSIVTMETGRYIDANASLTEMIGRSRDEIIGHTALELNLWVDPEHRAELIRLVAAESLAKSFPTRLRIKSGEIRDVLISAELIQLGNERCMIVVTQDITEQRRLEEQFRQAQKMEAIGQLAGGVAHDFNNLLTVIQGHAALLREQVLSRPLICESAEQISLAAERAASLTRQLLTFSRRQVMQPRDIDLNDVLDQTGKMLRRILGEDIELTFEHAAELPLVYADRGMIEQVLLNLAVNSRDAMPKGGQLTIATSASWIQQGDLGRSAEATPGLVACISVRDTGCGIPAELLPRIFEPFFTTKEVGKGTGLGLASAYGIVKQHKGWIEVTSELEKGTRFQVYLPASQRSHGRGVLTPPQPPVRGGHEGILLVEDEHTLRQLVRSVLEHYGYRIFEAYSGKSALTIWDQQKDAIDLVLTDLVMPEGISGQELAARLRAERPTLKVIFSSGYSPQMIAKDLVLERGINFLQKPFDPRLLTTIVRACLDAAES